MQILKYCEEVGVELGESEEVKKKGNPLGWVPTELFYQHLIVEDVAPKYGIKPEYFWRSKFTQALHRLGFKRDKKVGGISWLITKKSVDDVKERMGTIEVIKLSSFSSEGSEGSVLCLDPTNKTELNELNELNEPKTPTNNSTNKTELNELTELHKNNKSSESSEGSVSK